MQTIWVNELLDPADLLYACIACCDEQQAKDCNQSFLAKLTPDQKTAGWQVRMRVVPSWDEVPSGALKLD
ncbi:glycogen debranching protein [filamentous cyanobacterium LEGE 11480]|uniref:Glycogen debranching protein n=1 Tax=Romeriopsis navalis LEGE 11480 TaxID=2777977 RepID=A0A928VSF3_9CYAN|nr:glycogen debranching protein [Romeriopsis navalis]MBE9031702.1 glycogen debranching protein [Romeriopsis navalis LEGE 11480]